MAVLLVVLGWSYRMACQLQRLSPPIIERPQRIWPALTERKPGDRPHLSHLSLDYRGHNVVIFPTPNSLEV